MEELFKRLLDLLPMPLLIALIAIGVVAWVVKQLKPGSEYGDLLRDKTFRRASGSMLTASLIFIAVQFAWKQWKMADFRQGENGICVAQFQDDGNHVLQRYTVEQLRTVISQDPLLSNVRVEAYPVTISTASEARVLANRHHAIATIWGSAISGFGANIVSFEVTPRNSQQDIRKLCPKFPDIGDFTQGMLAFVKGSILSDSTVQNQQQVSGIKQQIGELLATNARLTAKVDQLQTNLNKSGSQIGEPSISPKNGGKRHFGIFIGIDDYRGIGSALSFSARDAQDMANAFQNSTNETTQIATLVGQQATRANVLSTLNDVAKEAQPGDQVWLYFAGIGFRDGAGGDSYLALADTAKENLKANSLSSSDLLNWIKGLKSEQVLVLLDACHSGLVTHRGFQILGTDGPGRVFIAASGPDGLAYEQPSLGHGVFTYYLLKGLAGAADLSASGYVTPEELFRYVASNVAVSSSGEQFPVYNVLAGSGDFRISDLPGAKISKVPSSSR
jgi:Caspase domain